MDYRPASSTPTTQEIYRATGTIAPNRFDILNSSPIEILPPLIGQYYLVIGFALEIGKSKLQSQLYPWMLRQIDFTSGVNDSLMMLYPNKNNDTDVISAGSFSGFFNGSTNYVNAVTNSTANYGVYLTSIADENWSMLNESYYTIIYSIETFHT